MLAALPKPDVKLDAALPRLTYNAPELGDGEMYFFFNESNQEESRMATIAGRGQAQVWDLGRVRIRAMSGATAEGDSVRFPLVLEPYEAKLVRSRAASCRGFRIRSRLWCRALLWRNWTETGRWT